MRSISQILYIPSIVSSILFLLLKTICFTTIQSVDAFTPVSSTFNTHEIFQPHHHTNKKSLVVIRLARYGPKENMPTNMDGDFFENQEEWEKQDSVRVEKQKVAFRKLLNDIINIPKDEHLPALMTRNIDLLLDMRGYEGVTLMKDAIQEAENSGDNVYIEKVENAVAYILFFVEEFVDQAKNIDDQNKILLGRIVKMVVNSDKDNKNSRTRDMEQTLDAFMEKEKELFTPGFLRHLEGECVRIASAPRMTPESAKMLETLRIIQTRVIEELGKDLGEGALVLGQLLGYDDESERMAVLDAGLTVRGVTFAKELLALTEEALEGFNAVPGGADQNLVYIVEGIDNRIKSYINRSSEEAFQ